MALISSRFVSSFSLNSAEEYSCLGRYFFWAVKIPFSFSSSVSFFFQIFLLILLIHSRNIPVVLSYDNVILFAQFLEIWTELRSQLVVILHYFLNLHTDQYFLQKTL